MHRIPFSLATLLALVFPVVCWSATDLFFSEYIEGSSNNKALEIVNTTGQSIDLSAYEVQMFFNGASTPGRTIALAGTLQNGEVYVFAHSSAAAEILAVANQTSGGSWFNGDDAVALLFGGATIDVIGKIGFDPGTQWGTGDTSTQNNTLRRLPSVDGGDSNGSDAFDPSAQWQGFAQNTFDDLGLYSGSSTPGSSVLINEVDADTAGVDNAEFIELYDGGQGNVSLDGLVVVLYNGNGDISYRRIDLSGQQTNADGYFVIGNAGVVGVDIIIPSNSVQNGADAVALYQASVSAFPNGTPVTVDNLIDAIVYDTNDADDDGLLVLLNPDQPQVNEAGGGDSAAHSNQRCANGSGGQRNTTSYIQEVATPGAANQCGPAVGECGQPATLIHAIQGSGDASPLVGSTQTIEGVVVGDFQGADALDGFFLQEESSDQDTSASTSEGIFVRETSTAVNSGDKVRVSGTVAEAFDLTELKTITKVEICGTGQIFTEASVTLPLASATDLERVEGMAVLLPQTLTVSENFNLGRFGEVLLSANGRLMSPTQVALPGSAALQVQADNDLNRLVLDDGSTVQNPATIVYPAPELSASNTLRAGDTVAAVQGVVSYSFGKYRIHPTSTPTFTHANGRTASPDLPGLGSLKIASFNVLNYFNGDGSGGGFPTPRGADSASELDRQRAKIINAIVAINADIVGLIEIENDGYDAQSAIQDLINGLNTGGRSYAFVNPGVSSIGTDAITSGYLYNTQTVALVGAAAILDSSVDPNFVDTKNRPTLAQTFRELSSSGVLTVAINHFVSKGANCSSLGDPDQGDGQGRCNLTRKAAAQAVVNWLATDPTGSGDGDFLIMGDLNAYAKEDPVKAIENAGYSNLLTQPGTYSFVFKGQLGSLDHALANGALQPQITGVTDWHINADEPRVLDYNEEFKTPAQKVNLYSTDPYRASDHDPVVVELSLTK